MVNGYYAADVRVLTAMGDSIGSAFVVLRSEHDAVAKQDADRIRELEAALRRVRHTVDSHMPPCELKDVIFEMIDQDLPDSGGAEHG